MSITSDPLTESRNPSLDYDDKMQAKPYYRPWYLWNSLNRRKPKRHVYPELAWLCDPPGPRDLEERGESQTSSRTT